MVSAPRFDLRSYGHHAIFKAMGFTAKELSLPRIAVINSWSEQSPGHIHLRAVADGVKAGIRMAGGMPFEINVPGLCSVPHKLQSDMLYDMPQREAVLAAASSGGVELYHVVGFTPEASSLEHAFGKKKPVAKLKFGKAERKTAYENLTSATDTNIDFIMLGCPHYTLEEVWNAARLLEGKHVHANVNLWIFTPHALKTIADQEGLTDVIKKAGAVLMTDTCPCISHISPKGVKTAATDSAKHAHYIPAMLGFPTWFGSQKDCIQAAITGKWRGELK